MPPKPKKTREEVIQAAVEIVREKGIDAVVAREVARQLGCTTGPIFTYFNTMDELREEVYQVVKEDAFTYLDGAHEYFPAFKEFGIRWIRYGAENPYFYRLLFMLEGGQKRSFGKWNEDFFDLMSSFVPEVKMGFDLSEKNALDIVEQMTIYGQGVASMVVNGLWEYDEAAVAKNISEMCVSLAAILNLKDDNLNLDRIKAMISRIEVMPERKDK